MAVTKNRHRYIASATSPNFLNNRYEIGKWGTNAPANSTKLLSGSQRAKVATPDVNSDIG